MVACCRLLPPWTQNQCKSKVPFHLPPLCILAPPAEQTRPDFQNLELPEVPVRNPDVGSFPVGYGDPKKVNIKGIQCWLGCI